jgi:hypothetical protein
MAGGRKISVGAGCDHPSVFYAYGMRILTTAFLVCVVFSMAGGMARAGDRPGFEIIALGGIGFGGSLELHRGDADIDTGPAYNGMLGIRIRPDQGRGKLVILSYQLQTTKVDIDLDGMPNQRFDLNIGTLQLGGEVDGLVAPHVRPFLGMTVGTTYFSLDEPGSEMEWFFSGTIYAGVKFPFGDHFGLRTQIRMLGTLMGGESRIFCSSATRCLITVDNVSGTVQGDFTAGLYVAF